MEADLKYATFIHDRSINVLLFNISLWQSELNFFKIESSFLKKLLNTYPFKSKAQNMFERIQLFILEIDNFEGRTDLLLTRVSLHKKQLRTKVKYCDSNYIKLSEDFFNYLEEYKKLKVRIYQYINSMI